MKHFLGLFLILSLPVHAAIAFVSANCGQASNTDISAGSINASTGNALAVFVAYGGGGTCPTTVTSVDDNTGSNTYTAVGTIGGQFTCTQAFYAKNITGNAALVVTAHFSGTVGNGGVVVIQVSGADTTSPLDAGPASNRSQAGSMTAASASYSTGTANEILIAGIAEFGILGTLTAGSGYTVPANADCNARSSEHISAEYKIVSATQSSITSGFSSDVNFQDANVEVITFKEAASATTVPRHRGGIF